MKYSDFCKHGFSGGMGFKVFNDGKRHDLTSCDFGTGQCEDFVGRVYEIEEIESFFYFDGTQITKRP